MESALQQHFRKNTVYQKAPARDTPD